MSNNHVIHLIRVILSLAGGLHFINFLSGGLIVIGPWSWRPEGSGALAFGNTACR